MARRVELSRVEARKELFRERVKFAPDVPTNSFDKMFAQSMTVEADELEKSTDRANEFDRDPKLFSMGKEDMKTLEYTQCGSIQLQTTLSHIRPPSTTGKGSITESRLAICPKRSSSQLSYYRREKERADTFAARKKAIEKELQQGKVPVE
ncbi:MAG: hypothetical protein R3C68_17370 [Myxococcota bacterium]